MGGDDSSTVAFVPSSATEPRIFGWALELVASIAPKDLLALTFARFGVQSTTVYAFFTWNKDGCESPFLR